MTPGLSLLLAFTAPQDPPPRDYVNSAGIRMVRIEAGEFVMGQGEAPPRTREEWEERDWDESPAHKVRISRPFHLGACEVTNAQYEQFDPGHRDLRGKAADDEPVALVTWAKAADFCAWLSKKEGKPYRLPSEAEWEYACRAGTSTRFGTGDTITPAQANFGTSPEGRPCKALPVGRYPANAWGLHDMHGNVAEWCLDWYGPYEAGDAIDPAGRSNGVARVVRGWSFLKTSSRGTPRQGRSANRSGQLPEDAQPCTGFRVALGEPPSSTLPALPAPGVRREPSPPPVTDPSRPLFVNYSREKRNPSMPADSWGPVFRQHNHYAAVCVCPNGDVLAAWYTTVTEEGRELAQACSRLRAGADRWDPVTPFFDVPDVNDHAPVLFCDGRRLCHFFTQSLAGWDDASDCMRVSDDSGATWSPPEIILPRRAPDRLSQPCSAFKTVDGTLVLACDGDNHRDERLVTSADGGKTWKVARGDLRKAAGKYAIHPAAAPGAGGTVLAFLRGPDPLPVAVSADLGETWEMKATPFPGISVGQKAAALRLASGALLLCSFDNKARTGAFAALSPDDGRTWPHVRRLEGVDGYLAAAQGPDGTIFVVGSRMSCVAFNEAWVRE